MSLDMDEESEIYETMNGLGFSSDYNNGNPYHNIYEDKSYTMKYKNLYVRAIPSKIVLSGLLAKLDDLDALDRCKVNGLGVMHDEIKTELKYATGLDVW